MSVNYLHITNGNNLTNYLRELGFTDEILTWQEMLCEGPTIANINSQDFFNIRADFLKEYYDIEYDNDAIKKELAKLDDTAQYDEINLWFEYDLFCHINLIGVISLLHQKEINKPLNLISSGRVKGEQNLKALAELKPEQIEAHESNKVRLTEKDKDLAISIWRTYCGKDHNILKPYILTHSNFSYLSNCLRAHLERFPNQKSGLSAIEHNILTLIKDHDINSKHHLLGYILNYQGFYGYGDLQLKRIIDHLTMFFEESEEGIKLNRKGYEALLKQHNFASEIDNKMVYGGVERLRFQYNDEENKLIKTVHHGN